MNSGRRDADVVYAYSMDVAPHYSWSMSILTRGNTQTVQKRLILHLLPSHLLAQGGRVHCLTYSCQPIGSADAATTAARLGPCVVGGGKDTYRYPC